MSSGSLASGERTGRQPTNTGKNACATLWWAASCDKTRFASFSPWRCPRPPRSALRIRRPQRPPTQKNEEASRRASSRSGLPEWRWCRSISRAPDALVRTPDCRREEIRKPAPRRGTTTAVSRHGYLHGSIKNCLYKNASGFPSGTIRNGRPMLLTYSFV
jgi:hypothetical protein